jgi:hypothetical protein
MNAVEDSIREFPFDPQRRWQMSTTKGASEVEGSCESASVVVADRGFRRAWNHLAGSFFRELRSREADQNGGFATSKPFDRLTARSGA